MTLTHCDRGHGDCRGHVTIRERRPGESPVPFVITGAKQEVPEWVVVDADDPDRYLGGFGMVDGGPTPARAVFWALRYASKNGFTYIAPLGLEAVEPEEPGGDGDDGAHTEPESIEVQVDDGGHGRRKVVVRGRGKDFDGALTDFDRQLDARNRGMDAAHLVADLAASIDYLRAWMRHDPADIRRGFERLVDAARSAVADPLPFTDDVLVNRKMLEDARAELYEAVREGGDDHSVGICSCKPRELVHALGLALGDPEAVAAQRAEDEHLDRMLAEGAVDYHEGRS